MNKHLFTQNNQSQVLFSTREGAPRKIRDILDNLDETQKKNILGKKISRMIRSCIWTGNSMRSSHRTSADWLIDWLSATVMPSHFRYLNRQNKKKPSRKELSYDQSLVSQDSLTSRVRQTVGGKHQIYLLVISSIKQSIKVLYLGPLYKCVTNWLIDWLIE